MTNTIEQLDHNVANAEIALETAKENLAAHEKADPQDVAAVEHFKAEVKANEVALKTARAELTKATKAAQREAEKVAKAEAREAAKAAKKAEAEAKKAAKEAEKAEKAAAKAAAKEANKMPEQNGVRRPKPGTKCGQVWELADAMSAEQGSPVAITDLLEHPQALEMNANNVRCEYAAWKKFYGITGRIESPKAAEARAAKEAEKAAAAQAKAEAKAAEKAAKAAEKEAAKEAKAAEKAAKEAEAAAQ